VIQRISSALAVLVVVLTTSAVCQTKTAQANEPVSSGRPLSQWIADLKGLAPQTRNAAAYEIAGMGPAAAAAVPALIEALDDPVPAVRFPSL
jgi:hypothetical protein